jgi:hypothetical protein
MTYYTPCIGCAVAPAECPTRQALKQAFAYAKRRGSDFRVSAIRGKCEARKPVFAPGVQVTARLFDYENPGPEDDRKVHVWPGVVIQEKGTKAVIFVRPGAPSIVVQPFTAIPFTPKKTDGEGWVKVSIRHLTLIPGAPRIDVSTCTRCLKIPGILDGECGAGDDWTRMRCEHVPVRLLMDGGLALVGSAWVDPDAEEEFPF